MNSDKKLLNELDIWRNEIKVLVAMRPDCVAKGDTKAVKTVDIALEYAVARYMEALMYQ